MHTDAREYIHIDIHARMRTIHTEHLQPEVYLSTAARLNTGSVVVEITSGDDYQ
jgi:hypothetical protein